MKKLILLLSVFASINNFPQSDNIDALVPPHGFGIQLLNSSGNSSIINDVSNIGNINPASIPNFKNYSAGFSYQFNTTVEKGWINNSEVERNNNSIPQSAGCLFKWNDISLGIGYNQNYNVNVNFNWNTSGIGEPNITQFKGSVHSYSFALAYSIKNLLKNNSSLNVGMNYSINNVNFSQKNLNNEIKLSDNTGNFSLGIQYSNKNDTTYGTIAALSYKSAVNFESIYDDLSGFTFIIRNVNRPNAAVVTRTIDGRIPDKINLDLSTDLLNNLKLIGSFSQLFWEKNNNNLQDQFEFSLGGVYEINKTFSPAFSIYYTDKNYEDDYFNLNDKFNALYLIAGLKFNYDAFYADLAIADSHLFSGEYIKQTIGKLAIGINL